MCRKSYFVVGMLTTNSRTLPSLIPRTLFSTQCLLRAGVNYSSIAWWVEIIFNIVNLSVTQLLARTLINYKLNLSRMSLANCNGLVIHQKVQFVDLITISQLLDYDAGTVGMMPSKYSSCVAGGNRTKWQQLVSWSYTRGITISQYCYLITIYNWICYQ